jgi:hypothetical protein
LKKAILICDNDINSVKNYEIVFSLGKLIELELKSINIDSINIYDIKIPFQNNNIQSDIEKFLELEYKISGKTKWINLTIQHVLWRYIYYYQFKERFNNLIKTYNIRDFTLSSSSNNYLLQGLEAACFKNKINFNVMEGKSVFTSSILPLLATFDIPFNQNFFEACASKIFALLYRFKNTKIFYENNNYLNLNGSKFSWRRSVSSLGIYLPKFIENHKKSVIDLDHSQKEKTIFRLEKSLWEDYDNFDLKIISSALDDFFAKYDPKYLDHLFKSLLSFFKISNAKKIILQSDNTCSARFLSFTAKNAGLETLFLPHGLMQNHQYLETSSEFGIDQILTWNQSQADYLLSKGKNAINFHCPIKLNLPKVKKNYDKKNLSKLRILVLLPEWTGLNLKSRPDCFENDFFTIHNSLINLGIDQVYLKYHNAIDSSIKKKEETIKRLSLLSKINLKVIDTGKKTTELFNDFDLVVVGSTTGIIELALSSTPFIVLRAFLEDTNLVNNFKLPSTDNEKGLIELIRNYDFINLDNECMKLYSSLESQ